MKDEALKLGVELFGWAFVFMILTSVVSVTFYVLVAALMGW